MFQYFNIRLNDIRCFNFGHQLFQGGASNKSSFDSDVAVFNMLIKRPGSSSTTSDKSGLHMRAKSRMFSVSSRAESVDGEFKGVKSGRQSVSFEQTRSVPINGHISYPPQEIDTNYQQQGSWRQGPISTSSGTATGRYSEHDDLTQATDHSDNTFPIEPEPKSAALTHNESKSTLGSITDSLVHRAPGGKIDRLPRNIASQEEKDQAGRPRTSRARRKSSHQADSSISDLHPTAALHAKSYLGPDTEFLANYLTDGGGPSPVDSTYLEQQIADYEDGLIGTLSETDSGSSSRPAVPISSPVHYPNAKEYPQADTPSTAKAKIAAASSKSPRQRPCSAKSSKLRAHCSSRSGKCSCSVCILSHNEHVDVSVKCFILPKKLPQAYR